jgi:8-oxo-dGTP pyrophosphatase MutT (NUDIX family)
VDRRKMSREQRIAAGAIIMQEEKILLVRYNDRHGGSYLVGSGGGVHSDDENLTQALMREVKEETGIEVRPYKLLFVEDLLSSRYRMVKIWFLCNIVGGQLEKTQGAIDEGIVEVRWYGRDELTNEVVYPPVLVNENWESLFGDNQESKYLELKNADF